MKRSGVWSCLALAAIVGFASSSANAADTLRWKFKKGDRFEVVMKGSTKFEFGFNGPPTKGWGDETTYFAWQVEEVDKDGTAKIGVTIDRITWKGTSGKEGAVIEYDSAVKKEAEGALQISAALVGAKFTLRMSAEGKIFELVASKETLEQMSGHPLSKNELTVRMLPRLQMSLPELPAAAVEAGAKWESRTSLDSPANPLSLTVKQVYDGPEKAGRPGKISLTGEYGPNPKKPADDKKLSEQRFQGTVQFDVSQGRVVESNLDYGYREVSSSPGFHIDIKQEKTTHVTVKPVSPKK